MGRGDIPALHVPGCVRCLLAEAPTGDRSFIPVVFKLSNLIAYHQAENVGGILSEVLTSMQPADVESSGKESEIPTNVLVLNHPT